MERMNIATSPELAQMQMNKVQLRFTKHAQEQAANKQFQLPEARILILPGQVVEIERSYGRISKMIVRQPYNDSHDRVLVLVPDYENVYVVVTAWLNHVDDNHNTLRLARLGNVNSGRGTEYATLVYAA